MKTLDVLTKKELRAEYHLTNYYIKSHDAELGGHAKPRLYDRERVELHLREAFWGSMAKREAALERARDLQERLDNAVRSIRSAPSVRTVDIPKEFGWRGGRKKAAGSKE